MKIIWIADFGLHHSVGGAQRSDDIMIQKGRELGHDITLLHWDSDRAILNDTYDLLVSANLETLSQDPAVFQYIISHPNHVRYEHDANSYLSATSRKLLFSSTSKTLFLSSYHLDMFKQMYGCIWSNASIVFDPIDTTIFKNHGQKREDKTLYVGLLHYLKGSMKFAEHVLATPHKQFVVAGWGNEPFESVIRKFDNIEFLRQVPYETMPQLYNRYTSFYYYPLKFEPFCRSVAEAYLCGMQMDIGDNIGSAHEYVTMSQTEFSQRCLEAPTLFWDTIT